MNAVAWFYSQGFQGGGLPRPEEPATEKLQPICPDCKQPREQHDEDGDCRPADQARRLVSSCKALLASLRGAYDAAGNPFADPVHGETPAMREAAALLAELGQ